MRQFRGQQRQRVLHTEYYYETEMTCNVCFYMCEYLCSVIQGGAGCADPGADEEGWQLIQPLGPETAGGLHGLTWLPGWPACVPFEYVHKTYLNESLT